MPDRTPKKFGRCSVLANRATAINLRHGDHDRPRLAAVPRDDDLRESEQVSDTVRVVGSESFAYVEDAKKAGPMRKLDPVERLPSERLDGVDGDDDIGLPAPCRIESDIGADHHPTVWRKTARRVSHLASRQKLL